MKISIIVSHSPKNIPQTRFSGLRLRIFTLLGFGLLFLDQSPLRAQFRKLTQNQTDQRKVGLAMPGILFHYNGSSNDTLSSLSEDGVETFSLKDVEKSLSEWRIESPDDLKQAINKLRYNGSNRHYQYLKKIYEKHKVSFQLVPQNRQINIADLYQINYQSLNETIQQIWNLHYDLNYNDILRIVFLSKMERWFNFAPDSIEAWDQARAAALVRWGYDTGYIGESEAWKQIEESGSWALESFPSWKDYVENYIYGQLFEYTGTAEAQTLFRSSALIWWELSDMQGPWQNLNLRVYNDPKDSVYLKLYRNLYQFQKNIRRNNFVAIQNLLADENTVISPEIALRQNTIHINNAVFIEEPLDQPDAWGRYPTSIAAIHGDQTFSLLLNSGFRHQGRDLRGRTLMHWAARNGNPNSINLGLQLELDPNEPDFSGVTPVHLAARYNTPLSLYSLLRDPRTQNPLASQDGQTPLHYALYNIKDPNTFGLLLQERSQVLNINAPIPENGMTPLMIAAQNGRPSQVSILLQIGADPNTQDINGFTALHHAVGSRNQAIIRLLLSEGADPNALSSRLETPLLLAADYGEAASASLLIQGGANLYLPDENERQPIHWAGLNPDINVLKILLDNGADPDAADAASQTPLHFAAQINSAEAIELLINDAGAQIDPIDAYGFSPLLAAISAGNYPAVRTLLANGADWKANEYSRLNIDSANIPESFPFYNIPAIPQLYSEDFEEAVSNAFIPTELRDPPAPPLNQPVLWNAIALTASVGDFQIASELVNAEADLTYSEMEGGWEPIHLAAATGTAEVLAYLISLGSEIDSENGKGQTALELAALDPVNGLEKVRLLLRNGASPLHKDYNGWSALTYAVWSQNYQTVRILLNNGADPNDPDVGFPPLVAAAYTGNYGITLLLLQRGADVNEVYKAQGTTALHYGVSIRRPEIPSQREARKIPALLIQNGAVPTIKDNAGNTPLFWAARWGEPNAVRLLLENEASPFERNYNGLFPFHYAIENDYGVASLMMGNFPADQINAFDELEGMTPLGRAAERGTRKIVAMLISAGADPALPDENFLNPLAYSLFSEDSENPGTLFRAGVRPETKIKDTPSLLYAIQNEAPVENIRTLLKWLPPEDIKVEDADGNRPIHLAVEQQNYPLAELLIEMGADLNALGAEQTPLIIAIEQENLPMAELLLEAGADVQKTNRQFETPWQIAQILENPDLDRLLQLYGATS